MESLKRTEDDTPVDIADVEAKFTKLLSYRGVECIAVCSKDGVPIRSTVDDKEASKHGNMSAKVAHYAQQYLNMVNSRRDQIQHIRIRSQEREIIIAPDNDGKHSSSLMTVVQNLSSSPACD